MLILPRVSTQHRMCLQSTTTCSVVSWWIGHNEVTNAGSWALRMAHWPLTLPVTPEIKDQGWRSAQIYHRWISDGLAWPGPRTEQLALFLGLVPISLDCHLFSHFPLICTLSHHPFTSCPSNFIFFTHATVFLSLASFSICSNPSCLSLCPLAAYVSLLTVSFLHHTFLLP